MSSSSSSNTTDSFNAAIGTDALSSNTKFSSYTVNTPFYITEAGVVITSAPSLHKIPIGATVCLISDNIINSSVVSHGCNKNEYTFTISPYTPQNKMPTIMTIMYREVEEIVQKVEDKVIQIVQKVEDKVIQIADKVEDKVIQIADKVEETDSIYVYKKIDKCYIGKNCCIMTETPLEYDIPAGTQISLFSNYSGIVVETGVKNSNTFKINKNYSDYTCLKNTFTCEFLIPKNTDRYTDKYINNKISSTEEMKKLFTLSLDSKVKQYQIYKNEFGVLKLNRDNMCDNLSKIKKELSNLRDFLKTCTNSDMYNYINSNIIYNKEKQLKLCEEEFAQIDVMYDKMDKVKGEIDTLNLIINM